MSPQQQPTEQHPVTIVVMKDNHDLAVAVYMKFSACGQHDTTEEIIESRLMVDYDADDCMIGIEMLGPVSDEVLRPLMERGIRQSLERMMTGNRQLEWAGA